MIDRLQLIATQFGDFVRESLRFALEPLLLGEQFLAAATDNGIGIEHPIGSIKCREVRLQPVVIGLRHRIKLVVVTAGTLHGQAAKGIHRRGDHVVAIEIPSDLAVQLRFGNLRMPDKIPRPRRDETGRRDAIDRLGPEDITGQLFEHKPVIRFVVVQ